MGHQDTI